MAPARDSRGPPQSRLTCRRTAARGGAGRCAASKLVWNSVYRATSYLKSALWMFRFIRHPDRARIAPALPASSMPGWGGGSPVWGRLVRSRCAQTVITFASFIVFTFGRCWSHQVASSRLTPRIIATTLLRTTWSVQRRAVRVHARLRRHGAQPSRGEVR